MLTRETDQKMWYLSLLYFLDKDFEYEPYFCNGCHDLMQKAINFNHFAIVSFKGNDYRIHFWYVLRWYNKCNEKSWLYKKWIIINFLIIYKNWW